MLNLQEIETGDVFSEISHYTFLTKQGNKVIFKHHESGKTITLDEKYVQDLLVTADQYEKEVKVGKEDKFWTQKQIDELVKKGSYEGFVIVNNNIPNVGDLRVKGIRTIWDEIHSAQVFTVTFTKQDKPLSAKKFNELKDAQIQDALAKIEKVRAAKKGVANEAAKVLAEIQNNPVLPYEPGEERVLRGYKVQFTSLDGKYDAVDMDYPDGEGKPNIRPINLVTIKELVFKGVKYTVE